MEKQFDKKDEMSEKNSVIENSLIKRDEKTYSNDAAPRFADVYSDGTDIKLAEMRYSNEYKMQYIFGKSDPREKENGILDASVREISERSENKASEYLKKEKEELKKRSESAERFLSDIRERGAFSRNRKKN